MYGLSNVYDYEGNYVGWINNSKVTILSQDKKNCQIAYTHDLVIKTCGFDNKTFMWTTKRKNEYAIVKNINEVIEWAIREHQTHKLLELKPQIKKLFEDLEIQVNDDDEEREESNILNETKPQQLKQLKTNIRWLLEQIDKTHIILCPKKIGTWQQRAEQVIEAAEDIKTKYYELIMAVGNKYEKETRHETALRYIQQAESCKDDSAQNDNIFKECMELLDEVSEIHDTDEYTQKCLHDCIACKANKLKERIANVQKQKTNTEAKERKRMKH